MKASEVLRRYAEGERNFRRENLQGQSFKGKSLEGADFTEADIRSADFSNANLTGANFRGAKAGLQRRQTIFLVSISLLLSALSGFCSLFIGYLVAAIFDGSFISSTNPVAGTIGGWVGLIVVIVFCIITIRQGIAAGLGALTLALAVVVAGAFVIGGALIVAVELSGTFSVAGAFAIAGAFAGSVAGALAFATAGVLAFAAAGALTVAFDFAIAGAFAGLTGALAFAVGAALAGAFTLFSFCISWLAIKGDEKQALIRNIAVAFAAFGGTSFRSANLTNADFTGSTLRNTDFREAILTCTKFLNTKKLDLVRPGTSYLKNAKLRHLVITGFGQNENFDRLDLRGINLQGANLENASFIDADFYQASLKGGNLFRTILVRTNFERADLRGANLTGSCIQDWVITESTKLDKIACDYVYLRWVDGDKRDQMPPRGQFKKDGFVTFVRYILETVELYHEKDINPRLALTVLQKMSRDYDEPLDIVALGKRGERVFIQVKVSENIQRENFKEDYYSRYDTDLKLWSGNIHQLPPVVNSFIEKKISEIASERTDDFVFVDATYAEGNYTEIYQGDTTVTGDRNIQAGRDYRETHVNDQGTYVEGDYYNNPEQKQTLAEAAAEIQQLLEQLEKSYPTDTTTGKMALATEAIAQIENNPNLTARILSALKVGSVKAFEQFLSHPAASFVIGALEDWQKTKES